MATPGSVASVGGLSSGFGVPSQQKVGFGGSSGLSQTSGSTFKFVAPASASGYSNGGSNSPTGLTSNGQAYSLPFSPTNVNTPGSSGGSGGARPANGLPGSGTNAAGVPDNQGAQGPTQDQINQQINDTYNSTNGYLDQAEQQVNADYPTVQSDINTQFGADTGQLKTTNDSANQQFATTQDKTDYNNQNALAQARALYDQLRTGYQQKFGGSTSAGEASNEIANVEQQRQMGQTNRSYNDASTAIANNKAQSDAQYQENTLKLETQKNASLNQANRDFQNKLLQIGQARAQNEQAKGIARLQALQDLRNSVNAINLQNQQFKDQLQLYSQFGANTTGGYNATSAGLLNGANQAATGFSSLPKVSSNLQVGGGQQTGGQQLTGQIGGTTPHLDPLTGQWVN